MAHEFRTHYTPDEANAVLPQVRAWLAQLDKLRRELDDLDELVQSMVAPGVDLGGENINRWVRCLADVRAVLWEFYTRDIKLKDLDRGLVDFPSLRGGREVFLCWQKGESEIQYWHDLDAGYAGRQPL